MYLLELYFENAALNGRGKFVIQHRDTIRKWTLLGAKKSGLEILRLIALATAKPDCIPHLNSPITPLFKIVQRPLQLEYQIFRHKQTEGLGRYPDASAAGGLSIAHDKIPTILSRRECRYVKGSPRYYRPRNSKNLGIHFLLAYGPGFQGLVSSDDFEFNDPFHRLRRIQSLFIENYCLTNPVDFLELIQYRGLKYKRLSALRVMTEVNQFFNTCLGIDPMFLHSPDLELHPIWRKLSPWRQRMAIPVIDICRHLYETFPKTANPFPMPGVMLFHRPDLFCTDKRFVSWIHFLDSLLPNFQFIITLADRNAEKIPPAITKKRLPIGKTEGDSKRIRRKPARLPTKPVLLVQVDGKLPNLALMKLSRYHKEQGKEVILKRRGAFYRNAERVYASTIFNFGSSVQYLQQLRKYYGDALQVGGSGVDLSLRLPKKIERMPADYTLYPELEDRAIGFVTRGCPHRCPFCIVPEKEGHPRKVNSIRSLVDKNRKKVILLDDNLLSHPEATDILKEIASLNLKVNFTQSLDMRYLNQAKAELLKKIDCMNTKFTRPNHYFSLNDNKRFKTIRQKYQMLGFTYRDNVEFICMYGFNTTLAQDLERIRFLRSLPGAYVFMQEYKPVNNIVSSHDGQFFEGDVDRMLDELVRIVFTQNMKSMEKYYKWISRKYAQRYNRLHHGLVDTIFKYNNRSQKGLYIATLAGTRNGPAGSKAG